MMVFSREWFEENQALLLRLANSRHGRRVLRIHGNRSEVGRRKITKIEPHAITWANDDGTYSTEFRTHAKYAKRLYHAYKPLWYAMHAWDMGIANKLDESLNLGFDTLTTFPQAGDGTATMDANVWRSLNDPGETFSVINGGIGTDAETTDSQLYTAMNAGNVTNKFDEIFRSIMTFDTSSIGSGATISAATLSLMLSDRLAQLGQTDAHIVGATPNQNNHISPADYQRLGATSFASQPYSAINFVGYIDFTLNSSGRANITKGGISGFGSRLNWDLTGSFGGTWGAYLETFYTWVSSDHAGTSQDPKLVVTYTGVNSTTISGTMLLGGTFTAKTTHKMTISGAILFGGTFSVSKIPAPVAGKQYVYRIYDGSGTYIGIWPDVTTELTFSQRLNTPGTTATVRLGRSANNTTELRDGLIDSTGAVMTDDTGNPYVVVSRTSNSVGAGSDVDVNYRVEVYVHYGGYEALVTQSGEPYTTDTGEEYLVAVGAPLGRRVLSGTIIDYNSVYTDSEYVEVTVASNGVELSREVIRSGTTTTISYTSQNHDTIIKSILDTNPGRMSYTASSIDPTGVSINQTYPLNTKLEGINSVYNQSDAGWYWFGNVGDNTIYFKNKVSTPDHTFQLGHHIQSLELKRSAEDIRNTIYFVGGDQGGGLGILYKKYVDATSVAAYGTRIFRITDRRYTIPASAQRYATKIMARYSQPIYTTTVKIVSAVYDTESIQLGQVVAFRNFNNFIDGLLLQIISIDYSPYVVTLGLGELLDTQKDIIADMSGALENEQYNSVPTAPS